MWLGGRQKTCLGRHLIEAKVFVRVWRWTASESINGRLCYHLTPQARRSRFDPEWFLCTNPSLVYHYFVVKGSTAPFDDSQTRFKLAFPDWGKRWWDSSVLGVLRRMATSSFRREIRLTHWKHFRIDMGQRISTDLVEYATVCWPRHVACIKDETESNCTYRSKAPNC